MIVFGECLYLKASTMYIRPKFSMKQKNTIVANKGEDVVQTFF